MAHGRLSQNFLRSEQVAEKIVNGARITEKDVVIEIGAGLGILTDLLQQRVKRVIAFETDHRLIPRLLETPRQKTEVICADFLKYDLAPLQERFNLIKVVSNLPYHISTEILFRLFQNHHWIDSMTLMFQKEVADRIVAPSGGKTYGILSVLTALYAMPKIVFRVAPGCFYPQPKVASAVVHFEMKKKLEIPQHQQDFFIKLVKTAFGQRRKTLRNALQKMAPVQMLEQAAFRSGLDLKRRAETLTLTEFKKLMEALDAWGQVPAIQTLIPAARTPF